MRLLKLASTMALLAVFATSLGLGAGTGAVQGQHPQTGFPSLDTNDGKFVALAGTGLSTVAQPVSFWIGLPADQGSFTLALFDGDLGGFWDVHDTARTVSVNYVLYADPLKDGSGSTVVASKTNADFADDAWGTVYSGPVHEAARAPSGNYFYRLHVSFADAAAAGNEVNGFKIRVDGQVGVIPGTFGFVGAPINVDVLTGRADPGLGTAHNKYNGEWHWYVYVSSPGATVTFTDTDADSRASTTRPGNPPDDCIPGATCFVISPDIRYRVLDPSGNPLLSVTSPSGDLETVTRTLTAGQAGFLDWNWTGVDGHNLVFISSSHEVFASTAQVPLAVGTPSPAPAPEEKSFQSTIRGWVYADANCSGRAQAGEGGVEGVVVAIDSGGGWSARTTTRPDGRYEFAGLSEGRFKLTVALPEGYARAAPAAHEGVAVDGRVETVVDGIDFGVATEAACVAPPPAAAPLPAPWQPPGPGVTWYLAEGCACEPFETRFIVTNPGDAVASLAATFLTEDGTTIDRRYELQARSSLSVPPDQALAGAAFSTRIESDQPVFVQRSMSVGQETRLAAGVDAPSRTWYLAEGRTGGGFDTWLLIMNPGLEPARATFTFFREDGPPIERTYDLLPTSRLSLYINWILPEAAFGARVEADRPIVVERASYFGDGSSHGAAGATSHFNTWYLADVNTMAGTDTWVLILNPNAQPANATLTFVKDEGSTVRQIHTLRPHSRLSLYANETVPNAYAFATVQADLPIVVDRSTYWDGDRSGYSSLAVGGTARSWSFPMGKVAPFRQALLVANPNDTTTALSATFLLEGGGAVARVYALAANARLVLDASAMPDGALWVELSGDLPVMAERAMQFSSGR